MESYLKITAFNLRVRRISRAILSGVIIRCITWYNKGFEPRERGWVGARAVGRFRTFEMKLLMRGIALSDGNIVGS